MFPPIGKIIGSIALSIAIFITVVAIGVSLYLAAGVIAIYCAIGFLLWTFLVYGSLHLINRYREDK